MNIAMTRRHLVTLADMRREDMLSLFALADRLREPGRPPLLAGRTVVNLFFEPSTRTRVSFELAAMRLGAHVVPFDVEHSSTQKGETLLDTLRNLEAMGCDQFVVRHKENGTPGLLAEQAAAGVSIITIAQARGGPLWGNGRFDLVFLDVPCSGSGTWRRQPELKWRLTPERLTELRGIQDWLFADGARHTAPGGKLVYATCSILPQENQDRVAAFLSAHPMFKRAQPDFHASPASTASDGCYAAFRMREN
mgnify:CR=1 FL=1